MPQSQNALAVSPKSFFQALRIKGIIVLVQHLGHVVAFGTAAVAEL
jgi:hypothetical protein